MMKSGNDRWRSQLLDWDVEGSVERRKRDVWREENCKWKRCRRSTGNGVKLTSDNNNAFDKPVEESR